jgi:hypothetical protein
MEIMSSTEMRADFTLSPRMVFPRFRDSIGIKSDYTDIPQAPSTNSVLIEELRERHLLKTPPPVARKLLMPLRYSTSDRPISGTTWADLDAPVFSASDVEKILSCLDSAELYIKFAAASTLLDQVVIHKHKITPSFKKTIVGKAISLHADPDPSIRNLTLQILSVLADSGVTEIIDLALDDLQSENNPSYLREQAAKSISILCIKGDKGAVNSLANIVSRESIGEKGISLRVECLLALSKVCVPGCHLGLTTVKDALKDRSQNVHLKSKSSQH